MKQNYIDRGEKTDYTTIKKGNKESTLKQKNQKSTIKNKEGTTKKSGYEKEKKIQENKQYNTEQHTIYKT